MRSFAWDSLWALFDGDRDCMNLAHECIDRHRDQGSAISVKFADGHSEHYDYAVLADEPMTPDTFTYIERAFGVTPCRVGNGEKEHTWRSYGKRSHMASRGRSARRVPNP